MDRRKFLGTIGFTGFTGLSFMGIEGARRHRAMELPLKRLVVFGSDALRYDLARDMYQEAQPGISRLYPPVLCGCGGYSVTQPRWTSVWTGMPSWWTGAWANDVYSALPENLHIMWKTMQRYSQDDLYCVWLTGKGQNIKGNIQDSPHWQVYDAIVNRGYLGEYHGDTKRENQEVFDLGSAAIQEALNHERCLMFIHFQDPDRIGHVSKSYDAYRTAAILVDGYISQMMDMLPQDAGIIYCSDHGFNFEELGEVETTHHFAPNGMFATNIKEIGPSTVNQMGVGRFIWGLMGGAPDHCESQEIGYYAMYGEDF